MKLLITLGLIYLAYRFFSTRTILIIPKGGANEKLHSNNSQKKQEDDYTDYEEIG